MVPPYNKIVKARSIPKLNGARESRVRLLLKVFLTKIRRLSVSSSSASLGTRPQDASETGSRYSYYVEVKSRQRFRKR